ncbi:hypothetical protein M501DRAFT_986195 [Patellaria atrata CBS 101060]|uniref:Uncharacterized protein n=1 Tax=Patellaria atrata CBS 101060 TaxID=1346257 RepID=A0A9P4S8T5_9PEZI|nr:hypothetical protein M501DRAFT_986195 [Patellaria atrata CBS 101060]
MSRKPGARTSYLQKPTSISISGAALGDVGLEQKPSSPTKLIALSTSTIRLDVSPTRLPIPAPGFQPTNKNEVKRRSLLQQKEEAARHLSHSESGTDEGSKQKRVSSVVNGSKCTSRPLSFTRTTSYQTKRDAKVVTRTQDPHQSKREKPPNVQATTLSRSQSVRKPSNESQPTSTFSHSRARNQSTSILGTSRRPQEHAIASKHSETLKGGGPLNRSANPSSRGIKVTEPPEVFQHKQTTSSLALKRSVIPSNDENKALRPAFSTFQQHYSPKKTNKAPSSSFLVPMVEPNASGPSQASRLQTELLQLHSLHSSSASVCRQWESSAKHRLDDLFESVVVEYGIMRKAEREAQEQVNMIALQEWSSGIEGFGLSENIQLLGSLLYELPGLTDENGRYTRVVNEFEMWVSMVRQIRGDYSGFNKQVILGKSEALSVANLRYVESIGDAWKVENAALTRKLSILARDVEKIIQPSPRSSVARIMQNCQALLKGMLGELLAMLDLQAEVMNRERKLVEGGLAAISHDIETCFELEDQEDHVKGRWRCR